ncbi:MAG: bifunctional phosphoribosylaminoimidazolecarboxamide formyltransferase/IMP cyclohydrolase [bacterium]|nr:bifunctional phosphoribosylaminoimidazolecarboxamide formyltransferase/IMP cyclohydrolase [bacterium]
MRRKALLSVYDKTGIAEFANGLSCLGWELISSGGTADVLRAAGLSVTDVADHTGSPAMLGHRVVTLHPRIHGGILADRSDPGHSRELEEYGVDPIDLVVVNLYPFASEPGLELIDIGGPALVRAAAKNHLSVGVVIEPRDYDRVLDELRSNGDLSEGTRRELARTAFARTASYDATIVEWFDAGGPRSELLPPSLHVTLERADVLRYGENPHQPGARYRRTGLYGVDWWDRTQQLGGMPMSYLNLLDAGAAWALVHDMGNRPSAAVIKHGAPCGAAHGEDIREAYRKAVECDSRAAFGGVVAFNRVVDRDTVACFQDAPQADVVIAPGFDSGVVDRIRARRAGTRVLQAPRPVPPERTVRQIHGGWLVQAAASTRGRSGWQVVTRRKPTADEEADAAFAWTVCRHVPSNAVVMARGETAWGIGGGQQDRVGAVELAAARAGGRAAGGACASDGFFPFADGIDAAGDAGVTMVVQPGGSVNDDSVIAAADRLGMAMVLTGERQFRH